jgi:hypothetical protein
MDGKIVVDSKGVASTIVLEFCTECKKKQAQIHRLSLPVEVEYARSHKIHCQCRDSDSDVVFCLLQLASIQLQCGKLRDSVASLKWLGANNQVRYQLNEIVITSY